MTLNEYQKEAMSTAIFPLESAIVYPALKLAGEAGEVAEKVGKQIRDNGGDFDHAVFRNSMAKELGDVLWYIAAIADNLGYTLDEIAEQNLAKLSDRAERGKLKGSGDDR